METDFWCDTRIIEQNYRRLQRERHPDEAGGSGIEETISINEAYDTLIDPIKRAEHVIQIISFYFLTYAFTFGFCAISSCC